MKFRIIAFLVYGLLFVAAIPAQALHHHKFSTDTTADNEDQDSSKSESAEAKKTRYIDASVEYGSNFTYRHQIDATPTASPFLYPSILFHDKSGLWVTAASYRLLNSYIEQISETKTLSLKPTFIETDFTVGWDYKFKKKTDFSVSYMYSVYDRNFPLVAQALRNTFEAYLGHDFNIINTGIRYDYSYENFTATIKNVHINVPVHDNYLMWESSHEFFIDDVFKNDDEFDISPMFTVLAGTNNFIGQFIVARFPTSAKAAQYAKLASEFLIQQFTLSLPVAYTIGDFTATPACEYTILTQKKTETAPTSYPIYKFTLAYRFNFKEKKKP